MQIHPRRRKQQSGTSMVELAICIGLFWMPLFLGTYQIGFELIREVMCTQICRDAGHMFSQGADFTNSQYISLLESLAPNSISMTSSGNATVYLNQITFVDAALCTGAGYLANSSSCPNYNKTVITKQVPVGSTSSRASHLATPSSSICNSSNSYIIAESNYLTNSSAVVANPPITLTSSSQVAYISEMVVTSTDLHIWGALGVGTNYAQSVF